MSANVQVLSPPAPHETLSPALFGESMIDCPLRPELFANQDWLGGQCTCGTIHMSSHNAVCFHCAQKEQAALCSFAFD